MDRRYYTVPGPTGIKAFQFIAKLVKDPTLDLNEPIVDNYLFEVGFELGWLQADTVELIEFLKLRKMLV